MIYTKIMLLCSNLFWWNKIHSLRTFVLKPVPVSQYNFFPFAFYMSQKSTYAQFSWTGVLLPLGEQKIKILWGAKRDSLFSYSTYIFVLFFFDKICMAYAVHRAENDDLFNLPRFFLHNLQQLHMKIIFIQISIVGLSSYVLFFVSCKKII